MPRFASALLNFYRSSEKHVSKVWKWLTWPAKLAVASVLAAFVAIFGLYYSENADDARYSDAADRAQRTRLEETARTWAVQQALLNAGKAGAKTVTQYEAEARTALELKPAPAQPKADNAWEYVFARQTQFRSTLLAIGHRGSIALLVISILFALAIVLIPFAKNLMDKAEDRAGRTFDVDGPDSPQVKKDPYGIPNITVPAPSGTQHHHHADVDGGRGFDGWAPGLTRALVPTVVAAGAIVTIGAFLINVAGSRETINPAVEVGNVGIRVEDFELALKPAPAPINAALVPTGPNANFQVPQVKFEFPASRVEQEALTALTRELAEYRGAIQGLAESNERFAEQERQINALRDENAALRTEVKLRPTSEQLAELTRTLGIRAAVEQDMTKAVQDLGVATKNAAEPRRIERVTTQFYLRQLNKQNQRFFNQLFRPGLVRENCRSYDLMDDQIDTPAPPCTGAWLWGKLAASTPPATAPQDDAVAVASKEKH